MFAFKGGGKPRDLFQIGANTTGWHNHRRGQLTYIASGRLRVRTPRGSWLMPPQHAVWIPPRENHWGSMSGVLSGWNFLIDERLCRELPDQPVVIRASTLMRALMERVGAWNGMLRESAAYRRLTAVLIDEVRAKREKALCLPMPKDRRALAIAKLVLRGRAKVGSLGALAAASEISTRTARRIFLRETGLTFVQWRQQANILRAVQMLTVGATVAEVADASGYATPSSFILIFRRILGVTPGRYLQENHPLP